MLRSLCTLCVTGAALALFASGASSAELKKGDKAPAFKLMGSDGKEYSLADFHDKRVVVLAWFPKAFTGGCTLECKSLKESGEVLKDYEVAYFTASCDDAETNKRFAESLEVDYPILSDPDCKVAEAYGVVNEERRVPQRWTFYIGTDGKILHIDKEVKVQTHGQDIAKQLDELGVEKAS